MLLNKFHARQTSASSSSDPLTANTSFSRPSTQTAPSTAATVHHRHDSLPSSSHHQDASTDDVEQNMSPITPIKPAPATWVNMPHKPQLLILALSRLVDFWQMASLQSYMVQQLHSFDIGLPESVVSHQAGILQGSFTAAQIVTSILWGRAADHPAMGRKAVLVVGLVGTGLSCIGVGFSSRFWEIVSWRIFGGAVNGTIGAARTMVAETVGREWHSRAFLLLPVAFNVANILGPVIGGMLVNPVAAYPNRFGGAKTGWMETYPYALPSLLCAVLLFIEAGLVVTYLDETLPSHEGARSLLTHFTNMYRGIISVLRGQQSYTSLNDNSEKRHASPPPPSSRPVQTLPFRRIWTSNVLFTLLTIAIFDFHMGAFSSLWIIFLSTTRSPSPPPTPNTITHFTGGLSFQPALLGRSLAILGIVGLLLQILLYPWANARFGLMRSFRTALILFPLAYLLAPYLALLPSTSAPPAPASGALVWTGIFAVLTLQVTARTFALPASIILVNNSSPHPSVLGTIHGVGQSVSSMFRTVGPIAGGYWFGIGLEKGMVGLAWWGVAAVSAGGCWASFWVRNGSGHEVRLPGEEEEEEVVGEKEKG